MRGGFGALAYGIAWLGGAGALVRATKAQMEAESTAILYASPDQIKNSPGVAKAWCQVTAAGALDTPSYNIASITDTGTGTHTIVFDTDFSTSVYACAGATVSVTDNTHQRFLTRAVGSIQQEVFNVVTPHALIDQISTAVFFGDQ